MAISGTWSDRGDAESGFARLSSILIGSDVVINLTGPVNPQGWTLAVSASYSPTGPVVSMSGLSVAAVSTTVIRVTMTAAMTSVLTIPAGSSRGMLYVEVWRTDEGNVRPLQRLAIPFLDAVR